MSLFKIAEFRLAQDSKSGFISFKIINPDGSISGWVGKDWIPVPFVQFTSLVTILTTGNAYFEDKDHLFIVRNKLLQSNKEFNALTKAKIDLGETSLSAFISKRRKKANPVVIKKSVSKSLKPRKI